MARKQKEPEAPVADAPAPSLDPLAGKPADEVKAALEAANAADENAKAEGTVPAAVSGPVREIRTAEISAAMKARRAAKPVVDPDVKERAAGILRKIRAVDAKFAAARAAGNSVEDIQNLRRARKPLKAQLSRLVGESADSVEAAEAEVRKDA
jgi:hypothetical protein